MQKISYYFYLGIGFLSFTNKVIAAESTTVKGQLRLDCLHNSTNSGQASQGCVSLSSFKLSLEHQNSSNAKIELALDPFSPPSASLQHHASFNESILPLVTETSLGNLSFYQISWRYRSRLILGLGTYGGATIMPMPHKLALASRFQYAGWNQTALTATYILGKHEDHKIRFAFGNGEGELTRNIDAQQYGAMEVDYKIFKGTFVKFGASFDGNNYGSEETQWVYKNDQTKIKPGFSVRRLDFSIYADRDFIYVPGLEMALSFQQNQFKDLDKTHEAFPAASYANNKNLYLRNLFLEDPTGKFANTNTQQIFEVSGSYAILANHYISANYETREIDLDHVKFFELESGEKDSKISQTGYGIGAGIKLDKELHAILEYHTESFNRDFKGFSYETGEGKSSKSLDLFNARVLYIW